MNNIKTKKNVFLALILGLAILILFIMNQDKYLIDFNLPIQDIHSRLMNCSSISFLIGKVDKVDIQNLLLFGFTFGIIVAMILYNLVLFTKIKNNNHLYFIFFLFLLLVFQTISSRVMIFFNSEIEGLLFINKYTVTNILLITAIAFTRAYFQANLSIIKYDNALKVYMWVPLISIFFSVTGLRLIADSLTFILIIMTLFVLLLTGITYARIDFKLARSFLFSLVLIIIGCIVTVSSAMGIIPKNTFTTYGLFLTFSIVSIMFSLVLSNRFFVLHQKNIELQKVEQSLIKLSLTDELSQLYNRRYFNEKLNNEVDKAHKTGAPLSLLLLDIDHFKQYNDNYGHQEGDKAITKLGRVIKENIRNTDYACRFGGEEFAIILTETNKYAAEKHIAERLHESLRRQVFYITRDKRIYLTISIGISQLQPNESARTLIEHTDLALYKAKKLGRNRTVIYFDQ